MAYWRTLQPCKFVQVGGSVSFQQAHFGGLQEGVTGAAPPQVGFGVGGLGAQLRQGFTCGLTGLQDPNACGFLKLIGGHFTPTLVGAANGVDGAALAPGRAQ